MPARPRFGGAQDESRFDSTFAALPKPPAAPASVPANVSVGVGGPQPGQAAPAATTTITPPVSVHSHHNGGNEQALFLIVQDGGIYYHTRAMGFEFADHPA